MSGRGLNTDAYRSADKARGEEAEIEEINPRYEPLLVEMKGMKEILQVIQYKLLGDMTDKSVNKGDRKTPSPISQSLHSHSQSSPYHPSSPPFDEGFSTPKTQVKSTMEATLSHVTPPAPIDSTSKLPSPDRLKYTGVTPEEFISYKKSMIAKLKSKPKYEGLLDKSPRESWELFKRRNMMKYSPESLEQPYLDTMKEIWSFIYSSIDPKLAGTFDNEMQLNKAKYNLSDILGFRTNDTSFYEDANALFIKIEKYYIKPSQFRVKEMLEKLRNVKFSLREDPSTFIDKYMDIHVQGNILVPNWPTYEDTFKAMDILSRLPSKLIYIQEKFIGTENSLPLTVNNLREVLRDWWINTGQREVEESRKGNKSATAAATTTGQGHLKGRRDSNRNSSRSRSRSYSHSRSQRRSDSKEHSRPVTPHSMKKEDTKSDEDASDELSSKRETWALYEMPYENEQGTVAVTSSSSNHYHYNYIPQPNDLLIDPCANVSLSGRKDRLGDMQSIHPTHIAGIGGKRIAKEEGTMRINSRVSLRKVKYIPDAPFSVLAFIQAATAGHVGIFTRHACYIVPEKTIKMDDIIPKAILTGKQISGLYIHKLEKDESEEERMKLFKVEKHKPIPIIPSQLMKVPSTKEIKQNIDEHRMKHQTILKKNERHKDEQSHTSVINPTNKHVPPALPSISISDSKEGSANTNTIVAVTTRSQQPDNNGDEERQVQFSSKSTIINDGKSSTQKVFNEKALSQQRLPNGDYTVEPRCVPGGPPTTSSLSSAQTKRDF